MAYLADVVKERLKSMIRDGIENAIREGDLALSSVPDIIIEAPKDKNHGDWACTTALQLSREARKAPREIASLIVKNMSVEEPMVEKVEIAGPGFINFFLSKDYYRGIVGEILDKGDAYGNSEAGGGRRVLVEFVSANPVGPMNVVNARAAAVGDTLVNLFKAAGYDAEREYYVNDAGNQIDMLGMSVEARYRELMGEEVEFPEEGYRGGYIVDIAREAISEMGDKLKSLSIEERIECLKEFALQRMLSEQKRSLKRFGVEFDTWFSERTLHRSGKVADVVRELTERGYTYEAEGALWLKTTDFGDDKDRVLIKSDGSYTYITPDLAYHKNKFDRGFDLVIDIWGPDHHGYVKRTSAGIQALGYNPANFEVLLLQLVTLFRDGAVVKMSKRAGEFITMDELIDDVGKDAARYFFITRSTDSHLEFDMELAKRESTENPVYYIQYAHARIRSILRQAEEKGIDHEGIDRSCLSRLAGEAEFDIVRKLSMLKDVIIEAVNDRAPNRLASYLLDLAGAFHSYYNSTRVITDETDLTMARLLLVKSVGIVISKLLGMMGISAPESM